MNAGNIETTDDFNLQLKRGRYIDGGYPIFFVCADGGVLSFDSAEENAELIRAAIGGPVTDKQWRVVHVEVNWEDPELYCDDSGKRIESAYAEEGGC